MAPTTTRSKLHDCLNDVSYPADKDALVSAAERNGGDDDTVRALRSIPPETYANLDEVVSSVPLTDDVLSDPERAVAHRHDAHPGVTERERDAPPVNPIVEELGENRGS